MDIQCNFCRAIVRAPAGALAFACGGCGAANEALEVPCRACRAVVRAPLGAPARIGSSVRGSSALNPRTPPAIGGEPRRTKSWK
jgi:hypothetical protein